MSTIWKNISLEYLIVQVNHYEIQIDHGIEILRERREIADLFNKYALYFRIYLIHVTIPIIQSYIQSSLSNKIFQKHV